MRPEATDSCAGFHPEEAGIMLDRLAIEIVHALAKNPGAVAALQSEADELLGCVGAWMATTDLDDIPVSARLVAAELEPSVLAQELRDLGEHLLALAEIADAADGRSPLMTSEFDPLSFADAVEVLRTELEQELSGPDGPVALAVLRHEIHFVVAQARTWASKHGSRFDFVDPPPDYDAVHCLLILRRLASDLRELARRVGLRVVNDNDNASADEDEA